MQRLTGRPRIVLCTVALWTLCSAACAEINVWKGTLDANWFEPGNWTLGVPGDGAEVSIPTVTVAPNPVLTNATAALASLVLATNQVLNVSGWTSTIRAEEMTLGGVIRHASNTVSTTNELGVWIPEHRIWLKGSNITILANGRLDGDYRGYPVNAGPGRSGTTTGGAGHSGAGGRSSAGLGGQPYGDPAAPEQPGSGGGGPNSYSRPGGGAIRVEASGQLVIQGSVTARGQNGAVTHGAGGSGGSIWLTCRTFQGTTNGLIAVDGGGGDRDGGGGSGGRIALSYDSAAQSALAEPAPLIRFSGKPGYRGSSSEWLQPALGTLHLSDTNLLQAAFTAKRFQSVKLVVPGFTNWAPAALTMNDCILGLPDGLRLQVAGDLVLTNSGALYVFPEATTNPVTADGARVEVGGRFYVGTGCWVHVWAEPTNGATVAFAVTGDLEVASGGGFDADYRGYTFGYGPGAPVLSYGGGGYGGQGQTGYRGHRGGRAYGTADGVVEAGSGGSPVVRAGQGGGAIRLTVGGRAVINGLLTARGHPGLYSHGPAGSGGGISVDCRTFEGSSNGLLRVDGGQGNYNGGSGGGGRIVVRYDSAAQAALPDPRPPVRFSAYVHPKTTTSYIFPFKPEMGTLYFGDKLMLAETPAAAADWGGQRFWHVRLAIPGFTNWAPASLTMSNCVVRFPDGFHLAVGGDLNLQPDSGLRLHAAETNSTTGESGARLEVGGNLTIATNAWIWPQAHPTNGAVVELRVAGDATLEAGGGVNAVGLGYHPVPGNTNGPGPGRTSTSGGGFGGKGGGTAGGYTNGLAQLPLGPGSPAGWYADGNFTTAGPGGGAIRLRVGGRLVLNGSLLADGENGVYYGGSGGSGGSIFVTAFRFSGSGDMRANGGIPHNNSSGGGGRIAVWHNLPAETADFLIANRSFAFLHPYAGHPDYTGLILAEAGNGGNLGEAGSRGFYFYAVTGTLLLVR